MKFSNAVQQVDAEIGGLQIGDFWQSDEMTVHSETFKEFLTEDLLEFININDIKQLIDAIADENGMITLPGLVKQIPFWNSQHNRQKIQNMQQSSLDFA